jgi:non-specific serine/threonine protein kinase
VLATSREALGVVGEAVWRVPSLALPVVPDPLHPPSLEALTRSEAVALFVDRAQAVQPQFGVTAESAPAVAAICALLDGIPLALELAAARMRSLSVDQLLARLEDRFRLLTGGNRTALERHQTLKATMDWSHALLTAPERVLFRLVDKSLVVVDSPAVGPARYRLLETVRQYAHHKLVEAEEVGVVGARHAAYYVAMAQQAALALYGTDQLAWLDRLDWEHANMRTALAWLVEQAEQPTLGTRDAQGAQQVPVADATEVALQLGAALARFWIMRSHIGLAWEWLGRLLGLPRANDTAARAHVLVWAANVAILRQDDLAVERLATEGLAVAQAASDGFGTAYAHLMLGVARWSASDLTAARHHLEVSCDAWYALDFPSLAADAVMVLGNIARDASDYQAATRRYAEADALARPTGDGWVLGLILNHWAILACRAGDCPLARRLLEEALALRRAHQDMRGIGTTLARLGRVTLAEHDAVTARRLLTQALAVERDAGYVWGLPPCLGDLAQVEEAQGQPIRAARLWSAAAAQHQAVAGRPLRAAEDLMSTTLEQATSSLRAQLGEVTFEAAWAAGRAMSLEEAIAYALEGPPAPDRVAPRWAQ